MRLSEAEAWREIARRIAEGRWCRFGLCCELRVLAHAGRLDSGVWPSASRRLSDYLGFQMYAYTPGEFVDARILAALWLALEAEDESHIAPASETGTLGSEKGEK